MYRFSDFVIQQTRSVTDARINAGEPFDPN
ncbi:hypothetical protein DET54_108186 [Paenibacillus pabuli]|uniref:Uncharacterized protein n=1 Tax=Paenibacillus pabuli TaxID=1472 RepID=A0ABX9BIK1_9BACL|nr:hypothetical protein DET54_108186 [Paenibacillus pabuli]